MAKLFKNNGLTIVLMLLFLASILGQWISGWMVENEELTRHGEDALSLGAYAIDPELPLLGLRELGERVPADVGLCRADGDADPARLGRIRAIPTIRRATSDLEGRRASPARRGS